MPKKSKSSKSLQDKIQQKLKKQFVKAESHKALKERVEALEKEFRELRMMIKGEGRKASPATKRRTAKQPVTKNNLQKIKGIGAVIEKKLHEYGITGYDQIAAWGSAEVEEFSQRLNFKGRIERERWVEQAKELVAG
jgi:predicted flap endonuclease-1-like 5' DNA nuclease